MDEAKDTAVICRCVSAHAASLGVAIAPEELAALHRYLERVAQNLAAQTEETEL